MLYVVIGVLLLLVLAGAGLYIKYDQSRAVISTSEWVRLMRKNDMRNDRATKAEANKSRRPKTHAGETHPLLSRCI